MFINRQMQKENVAADINNGILFICKEELNYGIFTKMNGSRDDC